MASRSLRARRRPGQVPRAGGGRSARRLLLVGAGAQLADSVTRQKLREFGAANALRLRDALPRPRWIEFALCIGHLALREDAGLDLRLNGVELCLAVGRGRRQSLGRLSSAARQLMHGPRRSVNRCGIGNNSRGCGHLEGSESGCSRCFCCGRAGQDRSIVGRRGHTFRHAVLNVGAARPIADTPSASSGQLRPQATVRRCRHQRGRRFWLGPGCWSTRVVSEQCRRGRCAHSRSRAARRGLTSPQDSGLLPLREAARLDAGERDVAIVVQHAWPVAGAIAVRAREP